MHNIFFLELFFYISRLEMLKDKCLNGQRSLQVDDDVEI